MLNFTSALGRGSMLLWMSLAFTGLLLAPTASASTVVNGAFDTFVPSNGTGGGWTSATIDGAGGWSSTGGNPAAHFVLNDDGNSTSDPNVLQVVSGFSIGQTYELTFDYATHVLLGLSAPSFGVFLDSQTNANAIFLATNASPIGFTGVSVNFVATQATHTLIFAAELDSRTNGSLGTTDHSYRLDNVSLALVPEPSTGSLLGIGLVAIAAIHRRR